MFAYPEMIVGMWLLPVVLYIMVPLSMLSIWTVIQFCRKTIGKKQDGSYNKSLEPQVAT